MNRKGLALIGAAAIVMGLVGNASAIPITSRNHGLSQQLQSSPPASQIQISVVSLTSALPASVPATKAARQVSVGLGKTRGRGGVIISPAPANDQGAYPLSSLTAPLLPAAPMELPKPPSVVTNSGSAPRQNAVSVPDGGATATLLAGSFCGLALLRKKLKT